MDKRFVIELGKILLNPKKIVIIPHRNPDGDALGSTLALKHFLANKGHKAFVISPNDYPNFLKFLPGESEILKYSSTPKEVRNKILEGTLSASGFQQAISTGASSGKGLSVDDVNQSLLKELSSLKNEMAKAQSDFLPSSKYIK